MLEFLVENADIKSEDRIAVGVSGGADSMLLLWSLIDLQKKSKFFMKVINVNHHIRGEESDRDSLFVKDFCEKKKIPYEIVDVQAKKTKEQEKLTLEESARKLRYDAFSKVMKKDKLNKLFLAHHKNDQAETILMNILRGAGVLGASGIKQDDVIFRPLLNLKKTEVLKLAKEHGINFVEDATNFDNDTTRNYLRNVVIPEIEKVYPQAVDAIFAFGEKCKEVQNFIKNQLNIDNLVQNSDEILIKQIVFDEDQLLAKEYLKKAFVMLGVFADIEAKHYDLAIKLAGAEVNSYLNFPHELILKKTYLGVKVYKQKTTEKRSEECEFKIGETEFLNGVIVAEFVEPFDVVYGEGAQYVNYNSISTNAIWRIRRLGDMFAKLGAGSKKLNDYFTDKKIDVDIRDSIPVLALQNQILVVAGYDVSDKVKVDSDTDQIVKITFVQKWYFVDILIVSIYTLIIGEHSMFKRGFSIFKIIGFVVLAVVVLFFVFKASVTGSIV